MKLLLITILLALTVSPVSFALDTLFESTTLDFRTNDLTDTPQERVSLLFPALLIVVTLVMFALDYGAVGVSLTSLVALGVLNLLGILYFNWVTFISMCIMLAVVIYKLSER